ncbi:hypothetical protein GUJ93_ZPchr0002g24185 [Zizania palustris]|uniref:Secreted protein n=1 Tax=Zizania palustris TaxID=103762 RepID=A0A8J5VWG5_ZIZPA|nr:hypothetical protein GUJ93_ZPchr0002g24185 [Zizania palustris]
MPLSIVVRLLGAAAAFAHKQITAVLLPNFPAGAVQAIAGFESSTPSHPLSSSSHRLAYARDGYAPTPTSRSPFSRESRGTPPRRRLNCPGSIVKSAAPPAPVRGSRSDSKLPSYFGLAICFICWQHRVICL